jgi:hypothetical protein
LPPYPLLGAITPYSGAIQRPRRNPWDVVFWLKLNQDIDAQCIVLGLEKGDK